MALQQGISSEFMDSTTRHNDMLLDMLAAIARKDYEDRLQLSNAADTR